MREQQNMVENFPINEVKIGKRFRRDHGDLELLAESIREAGLLQPIVVRSDGTLVAGYRRLLVYRDLLSQTEIPARVVDDCPPAAGELHENEARADLKPSERVALIKVELNATANLQYGGSNTKQRDKHGVGTRSCGKLIKRLTTTSEVIEGHGRSCRDYFHAARAVRDGVPELVAEMDRGNISIGAAAVIAAQGAERQRAILALPPDERQAEVRRLRQPAGVKRRVKNGPSYKQITRQADQLAAQIAAPLEEVVGSPSDRDKAVAALGRLEERIAALKAKIDAAPDPKPRRRRRKPPEQPRERPPVISEMDLEGRWVMLADAQRARASLKARAVADAEDASKRDGIFLKTAMKSVAAGTDWSTGSFVRWYYDRPGLKNYPRHLWALALAPGHIGGTATAECHPAAWGAFKADYLRPEQPSLEMCYRNLQRLSKSEGWTIPRSAAALKRRLDLETPLAAVILARQGPEALANTRSAQVRERPQRALEAVNADGHRFDVFIRWPDGKIERPIMVAWQDIHSAKMLSWRLDRSENADGYRLSFADLLSDYGIPEARLRGQRARDRLEDRSRAGPTNRYRFKVKRDEPLGLLTQLVGSDGIHWTTPYHGQSKPIERAFRDLATDIAKDVRLQGAYTGNKPTAKPENYRSKAIPLKQFLEVVADGIRQHNARRGRRGLGLAGRSFDEAFRESYELHVADIPKPTKAQLDRWLLCAAGITAHKETGAVQLLGTRYWSERLADKLSGRSAAERKVVVRFDPDHLERPVAVETLEGNLIAHAEAQDAVPFLNTRAARETARDQGRLKKNAREQLDIHRRMDAREVGTLLNAAAETRAAETQPARSKVVGGAFGLPPDRAMAAKADEVERMVSDGDEVILEAAERVIPMRQPEDEFDEELNAGIR